MNFLKKKWYNKFILLFILLIRFFVTTYSQNPSITYSFINYNVNQGLPSSEVYDLYQNPITGIIWIATDRGLVKYDGYEFTTYTVEDGLTNNVILNLDPDALGNIWCTTLDCQPFYIDYKGNFHAFKYNKQLKEVVQNTILGEVVISSMHFGKNNSLYLAIKHAEGQIIVDSSGKILITIGSHLRNFINFFPAQSYYYYSVKPESKYYYAIDSFQYATPAVIHKINDTIFLLTDRNRISLFNGLTLRRKFEMPSNLLHSGKLNDSLFWASSIEGGVDLFNLYGEHKYRLLENDIITTVMQDHEGGIWFSTISNGVYYLKNTRIKTLNVNYSGRLTAMSSFREKLFLAYYNGDVFTFNADNFEYKNYPEFKTQCPSYVYCDTIKNCIYLTTRDFTAWSKPGIAGITRFIHRTTKVSEQNDHSSPLFSTYTGFLIQRNDSLIEIRTRRVEDITILNKDTIMATKNGLFKYTHGGLVKIEDPLLECRVEDIDKFKNGIICASLGNGILFYSPDTVFAIKKTDGLLSNLTTEIFVQNDSTIWVATTSGANKIIFDQKLHYTIYGYTIEDGLVSNEIVDIDVTREYIWIATKKGLNFMDKNDQPIMQIPNLFLSIPKIIANGEPMSIADNKFQTNYNHNNLEIFFNAISFSRNQSLVYSYQLLPHNKEWSITSNRSIVFPALSPGKYQLKIRASIDQVHWSDEEILEIIITPPFWKTWWFSILVAIGILSILQLIFMTLLKQQKLKTNVLEMEMKALRAQMNPHFIFNSMASIQSFILKGNMDDSNKYLTKFSKLIRGVLENSKTDWVTIKKELDILSLYIELEQLRVKPFQYIPVIDPKINPDIILLPPLILQPFIENAIWHGIEPSDKKGILTLEISLSGEKLICRIEDNGVGRGHQKDDHPDTKQIKGKSYGIEITRERINALKKTHNIEVELKIIDKVDENNQPAGTSIEITLPIINLK
jgi:hypothetical protein